MVPGDLVEHELCLQATAHFGFIVLYSNPGSRQQQETMMFYIYIPWPFKASRSVGGSRVTSRKQPSEQIDRLQVVTHTSRSHIQDSGY